jgi:acyl carrier protein
VREAVSFAVEDSRLGEEVVAAVVLKPESAVTENELREFAAEQLAYFKVPRKILFLDEIPRGPTGKMQRLGMANRLGLTGDASLVKPVEKTPASTETERQVEGLFRETLGVEAIGIHDNFFDLGGDSVMATQLVARLHQTLNLELSISAFFARPTISEVAALISPNES